MPMAGVRSISAEYDSVKGKIISGYEWKAGKISFHASIPTGVSAEICFPGEMRKTVTGGEYTVEKAWVSLAEDPFTMETVLKDILDNADALAAFNAVSRNMFASERIRSMQNSSLKDLARFLGEGGEAKMEAMISSANKIYLKET